MSLLSLINVLRQETRVNGYSDSSMEPTPVTAHFILSLTEYYYPLHCYTCSTAIPRPQAALIARKIKYRVLGGLSLTDKKEVRRSDSHSNLPIHSAMMTVWVSMLRDTLRELQDMR
jgi:hypothetical protein